jgi:hypothetical protein
MNALVLWLRLTNAAHGATRLRWLALTVAWAVAVVLSHVGIPRVDPHLEVAQRPLESVGTIALCLPAALTVTLLADRLPWLTATSPRTPVGWRASWLVVVGAASSVGAMLWAAQLPLGVPTSHAAALWVLVLAAAVFAAVALGRELAIAGPLLVLAPFSAGFLVPFDANVVYNTTLTTTLQVAAAAGLMGSALAYGRWGARTDGAGRRSHGHTLH